MKKPKKLLALFLTTALLAQTPAGVSAAGDSGGTEAAPPSVSEAASVSASDESVSENTSASGESFFSETFVPDTSALPEGSSLFDGYIEQQINARTGYGIATVGTAARDNLNEAQKAIYDELKPQLLAIAKGTANRAEFSISADACALVESYSNIYSDFTTDKGKKEVADNYPQRLQNFFVKPSQIVDALLADYPFDFYWYDQERGYTFDYKISYTIHEATVSAITFKFCVAKEYNETDEEGTFTADSTKLSTATGSLDNAQKVVDDYADKTDYEKLVAYKNYICKAVTYTEADASSSEYQQMLNVFDDDDTTNAVCAGYSRAFQYLCELTEWSGDVVCYSMTGTLKEGKDGTDERHMWNVVKVEGISCPTGISLHDGNYMADITNCDTGAIGENGGLFLDQHVTDAHLSSFSSHDITITVGNSSLVYTYDQSLKDIYCTNYLPLRAGIRIMRNTSNLKYWGIQKNYDGTTDCSLPDTSRLPFSFYYEEGSNVDPSVTLSVSGAYDSADVGNNKTVSVTVTLDENALKNYYLFEYDATDAAENTSSANVTLGDGTVAKVTIEILSESSFQFTYDQASITKAVAPEWEHPTLKLKKDEDGKIWIKDLPTTATHTFTFTDGKEYTVTGNLEWFRDPQATEKYETNDEITKHETWQETLYCTFTVGDDALADNKYFSGVTYPNGSAKTCAVPYTTYGGPIDISLTVLPAKYGETLSVTAKSKNTDTLDGYNIADEKWTYSYSGTRADDAKTAYDPTSEKPTEPGTYTVTARCECGDYKGSASTEFTIAPAQLSFAGILANDKEYDGKTDATVYGTLTYTGIKNNDEVYPDISGITGYYDSFHFEDEAIGTGKKVTSSIPLLDNENCTLLAGKDAWKYTAPTEEPKAYAAIKRVRPKIDLSKLTPVFYLNDQTREYDGRDTAPALQYTFTDPDDASKEITIYISGNTYADAAVGKNKIITLNTASAEERYGDTYNFTYPTDLTGSITQKTLDAHIEGPASAVYADSFTHTAELNYSGDLISGDDPGFVLTYYDSEGKPVSGVPTAPGSYTVKCTITNGNYKLNCEDKAFTITKAKPAYTDLYPTVKLRYNFTGTRTVTAADFGIKAHGTLKITEITDKKSILVSDSKVGDAFPYSFTIADRVNKADWASIAFTFTPDDENYETLTGILKIELTGLTEIASSDLSVSMESIIYGESLADPTVSFDSSGYPDIDLTDGAWSYYYKGTTFAPDATSVYESSDKPTNPGNYTVTATYSCATHTGTVTADFSIARKQLSYTGIAPKNKVYDGTVNAGLEGSLSYEGVLTGDTVIPSTALATQPVFFFENADAGTGKKVFLKNADGSALDITMAGPSAWKYLAPEALPEYTADITPQGVGFNAYTNVTTDFDKVYDGSCDAPDVTVTFKGVERDGTVTVTFTGNTFSDKNVGTDKAYIFGTPVSETNLANYELVSPKITGAVTQRDLTVSIEGPESVVYGEDFSHTAKVLSGQQPGDSYEDLRLRIRYYTPDHRNTYDAVTKTGTYEPYVTMGNRNYNLIVTGGPESFTIIQATPTLNTYFEPLYRYDDTSTHMLTLEDLDASVPGTIHLLSYSDLLDAASTDHLLAARPTTDDENYIAFALREGLTPEDEDRWALIKFQFAPSDRNYRSVSGTLLLRVSTKYPINDITVSVADATYGGTPVNPVGSFDASALSDFDDTNGTWTFEYNGYFFDRETNRTFYESTEAPTLPGEYRLTATYESDSHKGFTRIHFTIRKKELSYTGLTARKPYDGLTAVSFTDDSSLAYDGVVDGDILDAPLNYRTEGVTYTFADAKIGSGKQILTNYGEKNTLSGQDAWKYTLGEFVLTGDITAPEIPVLWDSSEYVLVSADTDAEYAALLASLPEGLYADVAALKNALYSAALNGFTLSDGYTFRTLFYDFQVWTRNADGSQGTRVFDSAADILLPYPDGTDQSVTFVLVHMLPDGSIETIPVVNTAHGIRFTTASTSPFVLGWLMADAAPDGSDSDNGSGNGSDSANGSGSGSSGNGNGSSGNGSNSGSGSGSGSGNSGNGSGSGNGSNSGSGSNAQALTTPVPPTARNDQDEAASADSSSVKTDSEKDRTEDSGDTPADTDTPSQKEEAPSPEDGAEQTDGETDAVVIPADEKGADSSHIVPVILLIVLLLGAGTVCVVLAVRKRKETEE